MPVPARKMRVEVYDEQGNRYTITFEGRVTRDKALRILDIVELLGGMPTAQPEWEENREMPKIDKVRFVLEKHFPIVWFSARDVQRVYEEEVKEPISLSTVSTYLSRLAHRALLVRSRESNRVRYRVAPRSIQRTLYK
ncbi:hypothetical protein DRO55_02955 [Candidatus Bathyarchaeota archaeon]|nr:MAG: hypothetical protein DRO55_02955 [Candidatus Bathyarchaeota archaeon]